MKDGATHDGKILKADELITLCNKCENRRSKELAKLYCRLSKDVPTRCARHCRVERTRLVSTTVLPVVFSYKCVYEDMRAQFKKMHDFCHMDCMRETK